MTQTVSQSGYNESAAWWWRHRPNCALCGSQRRHLLGRRVAKSAARSAAAPEVPHVYQCHDCELIYPDPFPVPGPMLLQENYGLTYFTEEEQRGKEIQYRRLLTALSQYFPQRGKFLDVGCGEGALLALVEESGWQGSGVDISKTFVERARQRVHGTVLQGELHELNFPPHDFEVVSLYAVLEHIAEPGMLLSEVQRVLKPEGILYLKVPNDSALVFLVGEWYYRLQGLNLTTHLSPTVPPYHVYGFTLRTVKALAYNLGFELLGCRVFNDGGSPFRHYSSLRDKLETWGYALCHHLGGWIGRGISIEVFLRPACQRQGKGI